jgi:hypothetical protein
MILNTAGKSATAGRQAAAGTSGSVDTAGKFATRVVDTCGKSPIHQNNCHQCRLTSLANLPLVSMTPVENNSYNIRLRTL